MNNTLRYLRLAARPRFGRLTESQLRFVGENLDPCVFFAWGPVMVLIDIPERLQKHDPAISLEALNVSFKEAAEEILAQLRAAGRSPLV